PLALFSGFGPEVFVWIWSNFSLLQFGFLEKERVLLCFSFSCFFIDVTVNLNLVYLRKMTK
ncbi:hypothetical protein BTN99_23565, partial [Vibrio campbellii]